jgi:UDP-N-acetylmuramate--alanine ligase
MHLYFSGIGGSGISAIANLALDLGYTVSGSDQQKNESCTDLEKRGVKINYLQNLENIQNIHENKKIDWLIYSSSLKNDNPELEFARENEIFISKRENFLNYIITEKQLKLIAVAGTHGKTTTTAMLIWLFKNLQIPVSYIVGSQISFGRNGQYQENSQYLILEADEYDRHFLAYKPYFSLITSLDYDHPDIYFTKKDYQLAFLEFIENTQLQTISYQEDLLESDILDDIDKNKLVFYYKNQKAVDKHLQEISLIGRHNRLNAFLALSAIINLKLDINVRNLEIYKDLKTKDFTKKFKYQSLIEIISAFPGTRRRFEKITENLYSDYAHHPSEIQPTLQLARELNPKKLVVVYQPHQNQRQYSMFEDYPKAFEFADKIYWLPTYLVRENLEQKVLSPQELTKNIKVEVEIVDLNQDLINKIQQHLQNQDLVVYLGAGSIDDFFRNKFQI